MLAVSISHTANVHVGEDDAAAFRTIFFMSDTTGVYPSWNENFQFFPNGRSKSLSEQTENTNLRSVVRQSHRSPHAAVEA